MATSPTLPLRPNLQVAATPLDRVHASYMGGEEAEAALTPGELKLRKELEATWQLLMNFHTPDQAVPVLMHQFDFSRATGYRRCRDAVKLFGDVSAVPKQGIAHILYEYQMQVFKLALSAKGKEGQPKPDLKAANVAIKQMALLKGLNSVDAGIVDASAIKGGTFLMQINVAGGASQTIDLDKVSRLPRDQHVQVLEAVQQMGIGDEMLQLIDDAAAGWRGAQGGDDDEEDTDFEELADE